MKKTTLSIAALLCAAISLAAAGVSGAAVDSGAKTTAGTLTGAGATFPFPLISKWIPAYDQAAGTQVNYSPIGSGGGIAAITARTVDFGASDAPLSPDQFTACKGCVQIPWALSATAVIYNVPGAPQGPQAAAPGGDRSDLPRASSRSGTRPRSARTTPASTCRT